MQTTDHNVTDDSFVEEVQSFAASGAGGAPSKHGGETGISKIPRLLYKPFPSAVNVLMTYRKSLGNLTVPSLSGSTTTGVTDIYQFRLNSIYDCLKDGTYTYAEAPTVPVADSAGATIELPHMRAYWMDKYKYWTVLRSRYKINIIPVSSTISDAHVTFYFYHHGAQGPPINNGGSAPVQPIEHRYRKHHPGVKWQDFFLVGTPTTYSELSYYWYAKTIEGEYTKNNIKHEIVEDDLQQTWHQANEVPPTQEYLTFFGQHGELGIVTSTTPQFRVTVEIEYEVQLKDLKAEYQYITGLTQFSAITASTNNQQN